MYPNVYLTMDMYHSHIRNRHIIYVTYIIYVQNYRIRHCEIGRLYKDDGDINSLILPYFLALSIV